MSASRGLAAACALACGLLTQCCAAAQLSIDTIAIEPFGYLGADGKPTGMMYDIGKRIAEEAGFTSVIRLAPYARTVVDLEHGIADVVLRFGNDDLPRVAYQVATVLSMRTIIVTRHPAQLRTLDDLHGKTVGMLRGGRFDQRFSADLAIIKHEVSNYQQMLRMLMAGRIDGAIGSDAGLYSAARSLGIEPAALSAPLVLSTQEFMLHVSRKTGTAATISALQAALERLKRSGEIMQIVERYTGAYPAAPQRP
jgi:polar amino acid transport system substrate-binding protein